MGVVLRSPALTRSDVWLLRQALHPTQSTQSAAICGISTLRRQSRNSAPILSSPNPSQLAPQSRKKWDREKKKKVPNIHETAKHTTPKPFTNQNSPPPTRDGPSQRLGAPCCVRAISLNVQKWLQCHSPLPAHYNTPSAITTAKKGPLQQRQLCVYIVPIPFAPFETSEERERGKNGDFSGRC